MESGVIMFPVDKIENNLLNVHSTEDSVLCGRISSSPTHRSNLRNQPTNETRKRDSESLMLATRASPTCHWHRPTASTQEFITNTNANFIQT